MTRPAIAPAPTLEWDVERLCTAIPHAKDILAFASDRTLADVAFSRYLMAVIKCAEGDVLAEPAVLDKVIARALDRLNREPPPPPGFIDGGHPA